MRPPYLVTYWQLKHRTTTINRSHHLRIDHIRVKLDLSLFTAVLALGITPWSIWCSFHVLDRNWCMLRCRSACCLFLSRYRRKSVFHVSKDLPQSHALPVAGFLTLTLPCTCAPGICPVATGVKASILNNSIYAFQDNGMKSYTNHLKQSLSK